MWYMICKNSKTRMVYKRQCLSTYYYLIQLNDSSFKKQNIKRKVRKFQELTSKTGVKVKHDLNCKNNNRIPRLLFFNFKFELRPFVSIRRETDNRTVSYCKKKVICTKALPFIGLTRFTGITKLIKNANISNVHFDVIINLINV